MIYSINEGFFSSNRPNKVVASDVKAAEERAKSLIQYWDNWLKIAIRMKSSVCKESITDTDLKTAKDCMQQFSNAEKKFKEENKDRKLTAAVEYLIRKNCRTDVSNLQFSEDTSEDYKSFIKKISANGQYTKSLITIAHKFFKLSDEYTVMYKKRTELESKHHVACEEFGGMVGIAIGSIPVVKLGFNTNSNSVD